jgi:two-component system, OmpR family, alkaline phosphatase synthesis response regulator PhoP
MASILIAEDEPSIVVSLEFLLRNAGHEVAVARDGEESLRLAGAIRPDLVVLDIMLPSVSGFEVCRRIREDQNTRGTRVLMLTARGRESEMQKGMAAGADAYMTKPFSTKELMETVTRLLA